MTPPTDLGKEPPRDQMLVDRWSDHEVIEYVQMVRADYADYWRRRALAAEKLLEEVTPRMDRHDYVCASEHGLYRKRCDCGLLELRARVAAHFDQVKP